MADALHHVADSHKWEIFTHLTGKGNDALVITLPGFLTKYMVLELIAAGLIMLIYIPLARKIASGEAPKGAWWNAFEALLTFIRDQVAKPTLTPPAHDHHDDHGHGEDHAHGESHAADSHAHDDPMAATLAVDRFVPFLWTIFLFILFCNLLGMVPLGGSPTASLMATGALAFCSLCVLHGASIARMGFKDYVMSLWPSADIPFGMGYALKPMIWLIEFLGTFIKSGVLAVRLFANIFAGHLVLATIMGFIVLANNLTMGHFGWGGVTVASVLGVFALSLLELFVAFLQAFIFTFLTALFVGMSVHPQH